MPLPEPSGQGLQAAAAPDYSIVIPTHSRPERLRACIQGIARLDFDLGQVEVIVVNDGGTGRLDVVLADVAADLSLTLLDRPRGGPAAARNTGAIAARGRYLVFVDDDCVPDPGWLRALSRLFRDDDRRLLGGRVENALVENAYSDASERITNFVYERSQRDGVAEQFFTTNNIAMRADLFRALGGFSTAIPSATAEDKEFCDRWRARGLPLAHAPAALVHHAHPLTLRRFMRQHFNYGRGLLAFRVLRRRGRLVPERPRFYLDLIASPLRSGDLRASLLIGLGQLATLAGAVQQAVRWSVARPRRLQRVVEPHEPTDPRAPHARHAPAGRSPQKAAR